MADAQDADRKRREKDELYALDISGAQWLSPPGTTEGEERVEIARLPEGAVAMRASTDPDTVLRYTAAEWDAFVKGARDGEFDLVPGERNGGRAAPAPTEVPGAATGTPDTGDATDRPGE